MLNFSEYKVQQGLWLQRILSEDKYKDFYEVMVDCYLSYLRIINCDESIIEKMRWESEKGWITMMSPKPTPQEINEAIDKLCPENNVKTDQVVCDVCNSGSDVWSYCGKCMEERRG